MVECPYCGSEAVIRYADEIYGDAGRSERLWVCSNWPDCDAYVGCHTRTRHPLGRLANPELRRWKRKAHEHFDQLWVNDDGEDGEMTRSEYSWLKMGLTEDEAHIGEFDVEQCKDLVFHLTGYRHRKTPKF